MGGSRVAVVTGANKGIGFHIASQLVASGLFAHVILGCRDAARGMLAAEQTGAEFLCPLDIGDEESMSAFVKAVGEKYGRLDVLVNNAAMAFKAADPTPFEQQTKPTLDVNFRGTVDFTLKCLPLLREGEDPRLVNIASMAGKLSQISPALQDEFTSKSLTIPALQELVNRFELDVQAGVHKSNGWSSSN